jgi:hypothetical protein
MNGLRQGMIVKTKNDKGIFCFSKITGAQIRSQYNKQCTQKKRKPFMDKRSRFIFAVHEEDSLLFVITFCT